MWVVVMEIRGIEYYCMDCDERYIEHFIDEPVIWHCKKCYSDGKRLQVIYDLGDEFVLDFSYQLEPFLNIS